MHSKPRTTTAIQLESRSALYQRIVGLGDKGREWRSNKVNSKSTKIRSSNRVIHKDHLNNHLQSMKNWKFIIMRNIVMTSMVRWEFRLRLLITVVVKEEKGIAYLSIRRKSWLQIWMIPVYLTSDAHILCYAWFVSSDDLAFMSRSFSLFKKVTIL